MSLVDQFVVDFEQIDAEKETSTDVKTVSNSQIMVKDNMFESITLLPIDNSVHSIAKLNDSSFFKETMKKIGFYTKHQRVSTTEIEESIEQDPEYLLIVDANNLLVEIDNEIDIIYSFVRKIYHKRFPELEQLVQLLVDYLKIVQV